MIENNIDLSNCEKVDLLKYLPIFYRKLVQMQVIQSTLSIEISKAKCTQYDTFLQEFVETAAWGLKYFEQDLGLEIEPKLSYEQRRDIIKAKLRGVGTTTIAKIENIGAAFFDGDIRVVEDNAHYCFSIEFLIQNGNKNIDENSFLKTIEPIKPAHLGVRVIKAMLNKVYIASVLTTGETTTIYPYSVKEIQSKGKLYIASAYGTSYEIVTIYPKTV